MAIAVSIFGAAVNGTGNLTPTIDVAAVAGDMMLLLYGTKPFSDIPTYPVGWLEIGSATDGIVAAGNDAGSMRTSIAWKEHDGAEADPLVTNATNNVSAALIAVFSKGAGETWVTPVGSGGGMGTASTSFSVTAATDVGHTSGDMLVVFAATRSDSGNFTSVPAQTATGLTAGSISDGGRESTIAGGDMAWASAARLATAGTSSAPPVVTATLGAAHTGSAFMVRLRVSAAAAAGNPPYRNPMPPLIAQ
jgi:hypothetical protein